MGSQDITSLVDFNKLILISKLEKLNLDLITSQNNFFIKNGIVERAKKISINASHKNKSMIKDGLNRIISLDQMGSFKVLIISKLK